MKNLIKRLAITLAIFLLSQQSLYAVNSLELINIADNQRILSQKIATGYFFYHISKSPQKDTRLLEKSFRQFTNNFDLLKGKVKNKEAVEILNYIELKTDDLIALISTPYSEQNAIELINNSEELQEANNKLRLHLEEYSLQHKSSIIHLSER